MIESDDIALKNGSWVRRGNVLHWRPEPRPSPPIEQRVHDLLACPTCHARVDEVCRTRNGRRTTPHGSRFAPRLCRCGATLGWKRRLCDECKRESAQASKNEHSRRRRAMRLREEVA